MPGPSFKTCVVVFAASLGWASAPTVTLPGGTEVPLELLHHLNSHYNESGSPVYLAVAEDVIFDEQVLIRRGQVVEGNGLNSAASASLGEGGYLSFRVDAVPAVDGSEIPVLGRFQISGRNRAKTAGRMTVAFGLAGALTKGRMAYLEKGARFSATVQRDLSVAPVARTEAEDPAAIREHTGRVALGEDNFTLAIEKGHRLERIELTIESPAPRAMTVAELGAVSLVQVDGRDLPQPVTASVFAPGSRDFDDDGHPEHKVLFEGWDILQYCDEGTSELVFRSELEDGTVATAAAEISVKIKKKEKKKDREGR